MANTPPDAIGPPGYTINPLAAECPDFLEALRDHLADIDALCNAAESMLEKLPRVEDKKAALAVGRLWRLVEFIGREASISLGFADRAIRKVRGGKFEDDDELALEEPASEEPAVATSTPSTEPDDSGKGA